MTEGIRTPGRADAEQLADLHVSTWRETYGHLLPVDFFTDAFVQGRREMWQHILGNPRVEWVVRVAESEGRLIGFAFVGPASTAEAGGVRLREHQVNSIYVLAAHHGAGVGQALLDATLGDAPAVVWVATENPRAIAFYRRNGFAFDGTQQIDPVAGITDARMLR